MQEKGKEREAEGHTAAIAKLEGGGLDRMENDANDLQARSPSHAC